MDRGAWQATVGSKELDMTVHVGKLNLYLGMNLI